MLVASLRAYAPLLTACTVFAQHDLLSWTHLLSCRDSFFDGFDPNVISAAFLFKCLIFHHNFITLCRFFPAVSTLFHIKNFTGRNRADWLKQYNCMERTGPRKVIWRKVFVCRTRRTLREKSTPSNIEKWRTFVTMLLFENCCSIIFYFVFLNFFLQLLFLMMLTCNLKLHVGTISGGEIHIQIPINCGFPKVVWEFDDSFFFFLF